MSERLHPFIRVWAFVRKEIVEVIRQPRLVVTLVLAPFLILALFGIGYQRQADPMRAVFVAPDPEAFRSSIGPRLDDLQASLELDDVMSDRGAAIDRLQEGLVDVVVVVPPKPEESIRNNERAIFEVLHDRLDPYEQATIRLLTNAAVDAVNRSILEDMVATGQQESGEAPIREAAAAASELRQALEAGDTDDAQRARQRLDEQLIAVEGAGGSSDGVLASLPTEDGAEAGPEPTALRERAAALDLEQPTDGDLEAARTLERDLQELNANVEEFRSISPEILVSPFGADTDLVGSTDLDVTDFYAPGVIALLLQHLTITFAALSLVRERALGTTELFRVAPLRAVELLAGKYLAYLVVAGVIAASVSGLVFWGLGVPFVGSVGAFSAVLALLVVSSLGVGFIISSAVRTDTQAVNAAMIVLLVSIFFSGFFLSIDRLLPEVRTISWLLPITHALDSLRDVSFRGAGIDLRTLIALGGGSIVLFVIASALTRRRLAAE